MQGIAMQSLVVAFAAVTAVNAVSPVQKVVELLGECKAKVEKDLEAETAAMQEYTKFCSDEAKDKGYAIQTSTRAIEDADAVVEDSTATINQMDAEISTLASLIADKEKDLANATEVRQGQHTLYAADEKEMVESVDQLGRAAAVLKKGASLAQTRGGKTTFSGKSRQALNALSAIINAVWVDAGSKRVLSNFLQAAASSSDSEDDDLTLGQPQGKTVAYESSSGSIVQAIEDMQGKAEDTLSALRKAETEKSHAFQMVAAGLNDEIENTKAMLATAKTTKTEAQQKLETANGELVETKKNKAADEEYLGSLKRECQTKAVEFEERMKSGKAEIGAITKASEILESGVTAFIQLGSKTRTKRFAPAEDDDDDAEDSDAADAAREKVVGIFKKLASHHHRAMFSQLASMASSDPFEKIRGLIEEMIDKLIDEAQAAATHEAFCKEEMGKSKKSQEEKSMKLDKFTARLDTTQTSLAELAQSVKTLHAEIGEIDKAQSEATKIRFAEKEEFLKASKDFKDSATAVAQAIEVLQNFYNGASFVQVSSTTALKSRSKARLMVEGNGDAASVIIGVLEVSQEDFTSLLAESESAESEAQSSYDKMTVENKIAKASKFAEAKAKESQIKGLRSQVQMNKEDKDSTGKELDAILAYIDKLKPECETKEMSYEEKKAAREQEIAGLKDALSILEGKGIALVQEGSHLRRIKRA